MSVAVFAPRPPLRKSRASPCAQLVETRKEAGAHSSIISIMKRTRKFSPLGKASLGLLALAALSGQSYAALLTLGVNFLGRDGGGGGTSYILGPDVTAGVVPQQDWNNLG